MLEKYSKSQKMFYDYFRFSFDSNHVLHAYLIETNGVSYAFNLALDLAKFLLCNGKYDEKVCNLIDHSNYPNLKIIGNDDKIKKGDITDLKTDFSMKSLDNKRQVYILKDAETLNKNAANSILKFLEEPEGNVIAIILCDKVSNVIPTIVSRCQVISLINDDNVYEGVFANIYNSENELGFEAFMKEKTKEFLTFYNDFETNGISILGNKDIYNLKEEFKEFLWFGYYLYADVLNYKLDRKVKFDKNAIKKIADKNEAYDIIKKMNIIDKFIYNLRYNVNMNLYIDNFIVSMGSV